MIKLINSKLDQLILIVRLASFLCCSSVYSPTRATFLLIEDLLALEVLFKEKVKGQVTVKVTAGRYHLQEIHIHSQAKEVQTILLSSASKM